MLGRERIQHNEAPHRQVPEMEPMRPTRQMHYLLTGASGLMLADC